VQQACTRMPKLTFSSTLVRQAPGTTCRSSWTTCSSTSRSPACSQARRPHRRARSTVCDPIPGLQQQPRLTRRNRAVTACVLKLLSGHAPPSPLSGHAPPKRAQSQLVPWDFVSRAALLEAQFVWRGRCTAKVLACGSMLARVTPARRPAHAPALRARSSAGRLRPACCCWTAVAACSAGSGCFWWRARPRRRSGWCCCARCRARPTRPGAWRRPSAPRWSRGATPSATPPSARTRAAGPRRVRGSRLPAVSGCRRADMFCVGRGRAVSALWLCGGRRVELPLWSTTRHSFAPPCARQASRPCVATLKYGRRSGAGAAPARTAAARARLEQFLGACCLPAPACSAVRRRAQCAARGALHQSAMRPTARAARVAGALCDWRNWYIGVAMLLTQCGNVALMYFLPLMLRNALYGPDAAPDVPPGSFTAGTSHAHELARARPACVFPPSWSAPLASRAGGRCLACRPLLVVAPVSVCVPCQARPPQRALALGKGVLDRGAPLAADSERVRADAARAAAAAGAPGVAHRADHARAVPGDDAGAGHHRLELQARQ